ncbi:MAG TPA: FecR family protein [Stellaceae bacterium]|nr:FecR family protein [Stellaceae bacterium]
MSSRIRCLVLIGLLFLLPTIARAADPNWILVQTEGQVEVSAAGGAFMPVTLSNAIVPGSALRTGPGGRAVIENNGDRITVAPNSVFELPVQDPKVAMTQVKQPLGTLLYDMVPRGVDRFRVTTPYLAAVIKGTVFTVNVASDGAAVEVVRGIVEVTNGDGQLHALVYPGQTATASANLHGEIHLMGQPSKGVVPSDAKPATSPQPTHADAAPTHAQGGKDLALNRKLEPHPVTIGALTNGLITAVVPPTGSSAQVAVAPSGDHGNNGQGVGNDDGSGNENGTGNAVDAGIGITSSAAAATGVSAGITGDSNSNGIGNGIGNSNGAGNGHGNAPGLVTSGIGAVASATAGIASLTGSNGGGNGIGNGNGNGNGHGNPVVNLLLGANGSHGSNGKKK